jgi:hypothetical protein
MRPPSISTDTVPEGMRPEWIDATTEAQELVPEALVLPTPLSQIQIRIGNWEIIFIAFRQPLEPGEGDFRVDMEASDSV